MSDLRNLPRRFYEEVAVADLGEAQFQILLDERTVKTPEANMLVVKSRALAEGIRDEWAQQDTYIDPVTMPLTALANSSIDKIASSRDEVVGSLKPFLDTDTIRYVDSGTEDLALAQEAAWMPLRQWFELSFAIDASRVEGFDAPKFDRGSIGRLDNRFASLDEYALGGLYRLVTVTGSLILGLAALDGRITGLEAYELALLEELRQAEKWGQDTEAEVRRARIKRDILAAECFIQLSRKD